MMKAILKLFSIKKDERWAALLLTCYLVMLNVLAIQQHFEEFTCSEHVGFYSLFFQYFHLSGFDPFTYVILSEWRSLYVLSRHPLLAVFIYPLYTLNSCLMALTGFNCTIFIWSTVLVVLGVYSFLFLKRILHEIVGYNRGDSWLLVAFFASFGYIMLSLVAPDHFALSLFFLLFTLYVCGKVLVHHHVEISDWHIAILLFLTTGITTTNALKIALAQWFMRGRKFFRPKSFLISIVLPIVLVAGGYALVNEYIQKPEQERRERSIAQRMERDASFKKKLALSHAAAKKRHAKGLAEGENLYWVDLHLSRPRSIVENFFGESLLFHADHLFEDVNVSRPTFVSYRHPWCYSAVYIVLGLLIWSCIITFKNRFMQLCLSWFGCDVLLHLCLGFGLTEVYIMTAHWAFVIPIAFGFLCVRLQQQAQGRFMRQAVPAFRLLIGSCTLLFFSHNLQLFITFMLQK